MADRESVALIVTTPLSNSVHDLLLTSQKSPSTTELMFSVDLVWLQVFAVVEKAGTVVMNDGEELDSWSVLINGHVEVEHANGHIEHLQMGDR